MGRHRSRHAGSIPPTLVRLIHAAKRAGNDAEGRDIRGAAEALREFGALALWALPIHGVFIPNTDRVSVLIDRVAKQRFGLNEARIELRDALKIVQRFEERDPIETAINHVQAVSDEAHFYAGVAFGAALTDLYYWRPL